jgi:cytochrome d ubiquinol oxidase subunit II
MIELWFGVLALTLIAYAVLDGFDFGAGALLLFVGKTDAERQRVIQSIGPFWDGNEVWLIASGGVLFVAFPRALATVFPAFYLAFFLVLWCLILRGISIEVRGHLRDGMWRSFWEVVFALSSTLLALLFGVALGNVVRGVPIDETRHFTMPFFTNFSPFGRVGLLDWYTVSIGLFAVVLLAVHGAVFLSWRTLGELESRTRGLAVRLSWVALISFVAISVETWFVRPEFFASLGKRPLAWAFSAVAAGGVAALVTGLKQKRDLRAFLGSTAFMVGILAATAAALYPTLLVSTIASEHSLTAQAAAGPPKGLAVALVWWPVAFALAVTYFAILFRTHRGKI